MTSRGRSGVEIHGPSVGIGAAVTGLVIVAAFFAFEPAVRPGPEPAVIPEAPSELDMLVLHGSPVLGSPDARVTLVEFGDYQCFYCNKFFHDTEGRLFADYVDTGMVKVIFKDYTIIGQDSVHAAHGAHCAEDQGLFWEYHDILYENWDGENNGWASLENLRGFASDIGLDVTEWQECMINEEHRDTIESSNGDARALGLTGTPAFFVIGPDGHTARIIGAQPYDVFADAFEAELAG